MTRKQLIKALDKVFSQYIRTRDCLLTTGTLYEGICVTCDRRVHIKKCDCGHWQKRQHYSTRWNEQNCALQCKHDNAFEQGKDVEFRAAIVRRYGETTALMLEAEAKKPRKYYDFELLALIDYWKKKLKDLQEPEPMRQIVQNEGLNNA